MKNSKKHVIYPGLGLAMLMLPGMGAAATFCAEPTGAGGCFTTIQAAVDAAGPGDTIEIEKGTYFEDVVIPLGKTGLTLEGQSSAKKVIIDADDPSTGAGIEVLSNLVTITRLSVINGNAVGIRVDALVLGTHINDVRVSGSEDDCIQIEGDHTTIEHSELVGCGNDGLESDANYTVVQHNTVTNTDQEGIDVVGDYATIDNNFVSVVDDSICIEVRGNNNEITNNEGEVCDGDTFDISGNAFSVVKNTASGSKIGFDISCQSCTNASVRNNTSEGSSESDGFYISSDASGLKVKGNLSENSHRSGFNVVNGSIEIVLEENIARMNGTADSDAGFKIYGSGHTLIRNSAMESHGDGYSVTGDGHTLDDNIASENIGDGFDVQQDATNVMVLNNESSDNLGMGFEVSGPGGDPAADMTTVDGNTASSNRTDFCDEGTNTTVGTNTFGTTGACAIGDSL